MTHAKTRKCVGVLALPGAVLYAIASPLHVFARLASAHFTSLVIGLTPDPITTDNGLVIHPNYDLDTAPHLDVLIIAGTTTAPNAPAPTAALRTIAGAVNNRTTVAAICTGAFIAAQTGLLDGHPVAAHWAIANQLQTRFPAIDVDPHRLFTTNAPIQTCAGSSASYELFLDIIRQQTNPATARSVARSLLYPLTRDQTSPQVIGHPTLRTHSDTILHAQQWRLARIQYRISVTDWAERFAFSSQQFHRTFNALTGATPHQWLTEQRMLLAAAQLDHSTEPLTTIADSVGFTSLSAFRRQFHLRWGQSPTAYRHQTHNKVQIPHDPM